MHGRKAVASTRVRPKQNRHIPDHPVGLGQRPAVGVGDERPGHQRQDDFLLLTHGLHGPGEVSQVVEGISEPLEDLREAAAVLGRPVGSGRQRERGLVPDQGLEARARPPQRLDPRRRAVGLVQRDALQGIAFCLQPPGAPVAGVLPGQ